MNIEKSLDLVSAKTALNIEYFGERFPSATTTNDIYRIVNNADWTEGFWTGILWMMYEHTQKDIYKKTALKNVDSFLERLEKNIVLDHHDLGFLYQLSCVAAYKITGNELAKEVAIKAADKLLLRWQENPGFIQAWGHMNDESEHRFIIDSLLNLPLLYWANEVTGDPKYTQVAEKHFSICLRYLIRNDGSSYHTYYVDPKTGKPSHGLTKQGYSDDSSWARGQAWAIYGIALNYRYNPNEELIDKFIEVTDYFINHLPKDRVAYWDLIFDESSGHPRDSGSSAIAVCGILEMLPSIKNESVRKRYQGEADLMMENLMKFYANTDMVPGAPLLDEGVYSWHEDNGVNEGNLWGDYFYTEALMRYQYNDWKTYW